MNNANANVNKPKIPFIISKINSTNALSVINNTKLFPKNKL